MNNVYAKGQFAAKIKGFEHMNKPEVRAKTKSKISASRLAREAKKTAMYEHQESIKAAQEALKNAQEKSDGR